MDRWLQEWTNEVMKMMDLRDCAKGSTENEEIAQNEDDRGDHQSNGRRQGASLVGVPKKVM